jgi:hypothetical protein
LAALAFMFLNFFNEKNTSNFYVLPSLFEFLTLRHPGVFWSDSVAFAYVGNMKDLAFLF